MAIKVRITVFDDDSYKIEHHPIDLDRKTDEILFVMTDTLDPELMGNEDGAPTPIDPRDLEIVGFFTQEDKKHEIFTAQAQARNSSDESTMRIAVDKLRRGVFNYLLIYRRISDQKNKPGAVYVIDPQIRNR